MSEISGKSILITGASRGVGKQIAMGAAKEGCKVILHSRSLAHTEELAAQLQSDGVEVLQVEADLAKPEAIESMLDKALEWAGGTIDMVYNNAAIMTPWCDGHTAPVEDYRLSFEVNTIAPSKICDRLLPLMVKQGWGRAVIVTSGIENQPELMPYSMSKAAVDRYVRDHVPSLEGTGVLLNLMDPGWLQTDLGGDQAPNTVETVMPGALVPLKLKESDGSGKLYWAQEYRED